MTMMAHPMTLGGDDTPRYSARDVRTMLNTFLAPADGSGSMFSVIQGIKMTSDQPICTVSGRTATIRAHIGILCPYPSAGPYTYKSSDMQVILPNTSQSWKIAVLIDDPSEGHGSNARVYLDTYPSSTPDSDIFGLVLAIVHDGTADDVAPRLFIAPKIVVNSADRLSSIPAMDGQTALVKGTQTEYVYTDGRWDTKHRDYWRGDARRSDNTLNLNNGRTDLSIVTTDGNINATISYDDGGARVTGFPIGDYYITAQLYAQGFGQPTWINFGVDAVQGTTFLISSYNESSVWNAGYSGAGVATIAHIPNRNSGFIISINTVWQGNANPTMRIPIQVSALRL